MVESEATQPAVIIDNGSGMVKAGFSGEEAPAAVFPSVVGTPKTKSAMHGVSQKEHYVGEEAISKKGILEITYPIAHGKVENWEDMTRVWHHTFYSCLRVDPKDCGGALLTEAPLQPKANREKMAEIMFESIQVSKFYVAIQAVMSLYSAGRTTGLVVDSGDGVSHTVPVYEGFSIPHAINRMDIAGRVLTGYVKKLVLEHLGEDMTSSSEMEVVKGIKESLCFVAETSEQYDELVASAASSTEHDKNYTLPDKRVLNVKGAVRFKGPELLFKPDLDGWSCDSIHKLTVGSIEKSDLDVRKELAKQMILSGGSTMYQNLPERLKAECVAALPAGSEVRVIADASRKYSVWRGASTLSTLSSFAASWVTSAEYEELGAAIIGRKCG